MPELIVTDEMVNAAFRAYYPRGFTSNEVRREVVWEGFREALTAALGVMPVSPSVRLARWEDGHPERRSRTRKYQGAYEHWRCRLTDEEGRAWWAEGASRDEARKAALDQAEGVQDGRG